MLAQFQKYLRDQDLMVEENRVLLAVSGGIDSMVMLDLFYHAGFQCEIAHCNFGLRGEESDEDEVFVQQAAERYEIPFHTKRFQTNDYALAKGISIQMAARELRYDWFDDLREESGCEFIATAHNKNDQVETFFINLLRGTGIRGLTGISAKSEHLIRPLLWASRNDIERYADESNLNYREDSSNASTKYKRNKIRHHIIPELEEIRPDFLQVMEENMERIKLSGEIYLETIRRKKESIIEREKDYLRLPIERLKELDPLEAWLYEILNDYDFSFPVVKDIAKSLDGRSGKQFLSSNYRLVKDRDCLIIEPRREEGQRRYYIEESLVKISEPIEIHFRIIEENVSDFKIPPYPEVACVDVDSLNFPLIIRKWEQGDYFMPLGMKNMKKLSDFFIDNKLSVPQKEKTWIITSGKDIVWVTGLRIDERFKITPDTERILVMEIINEG